MNSDGGHGRRPQQMARINVPDNEWLECRVLAMKQKRSVADYLGELVRREVG